MTDDWSALEETISDDSSFYGDEETKDFLEEKASAYDPLPYWSHIHQHQLSTIAYRNLTSSSSTAAAPAATVSTAKSPASRRRHPHDGRTHCWQLTESVSEFLKRLPPSTTRAEDIGSWIHVRNPLDATDYDATNVADLVAKGTGLLHSFENEKTRLEAEHAKKGARATGRRNTAPLTRKINALREQLKADLFAVARNAGVTTGKWMLFPTEDRVDEFWAAIAEATVKGELGVEAKVATKDEEGEKAGGGTSVRLIAVYTQDFEDKDDIRRVLLKLVDLGLVKEDQRPIYYKCDAYTYLEIKSRNSYGLNASMYSSRDVLTGKI